MQKNRYTDYLDTTKKIRSSKILYKLLVGQEVQEEELAEVHYGEL